MGVWSSYTAVGPVDAPPIVLIHGTRLSRGMWHPQLVALSGGFRVIALDLPGHGALRDQPFVWDEAVDEIVRVIERPFGDRRDLTVDRFHEELWSAGFDAERHAL